MKQAELKVGDRVWTYVGEERVRVKVLREEVSISWPSGRRQTRYRVVREDNGKELPKARVANALHPLGRMDGTGAYPLRADEVQS